MTNVQMYWGSSDIPSGIPAPGLDVDYTSTTGRGLQINGQLEGPGCGKWTCGKRVAMLTYLGRFYLEPQRMPEDGRLFISAPNVNFSGNLRAEAIGGAIFDNTTVRVGLRLRQYVYSGRTNIGMKEIRMPRFVNLTSDDATGNHPLPENISVPAFCWELNRSQTLEIDVEVRFLMHLEGDCRLRFWSVWGGTDQFSFDVPQWFIEKSDTSPSYDDVLDREFNLPPWDFVQPR